ncbi:MAG: NapC/NirT family cytochrome c [Desulfovibrionales bacterium]|nr:NapC/NirT family cytochrome c [Desulfovibrionales bacterium]
MTKKPSTRRLKWVLIPALLLLVVGLAVPLELTSRTSYCISCHEQKPHKAEQDKSVHALDKDKNPIECRQCHIPLGFGPKFMVVKIRGLKDLFIHITQKPERLDRRRLQASARRFIPDANCRACHMDLMKTTKDEKISEIGRLSHQAYLGENGTTKRKCAGCHFNMAHLPDFDRRYTFNAEFAKNIPPEQERTP